MYSHGLIVSDNELILSGHDLIALDHERIVPGRM